MKTQINIGRITRIFLFLLVLSFLVRILNFAFYNDNSYTRVMFHEMYTEKKIDVVFIGSSAVYRSFDPEIWDTCLGKKTFNLGTSSQTPDAAYYVMREVFKNQSPEYCIYGINHLLFIDWYVYDDPKKDYIIFDYLKPSLNKYIYGCMAFWDNSILNGWIPATRNANKDVIKIVSEVNSIKKKASYKNYGYDVYESSAEQYKGRGFVYSNRQTTEGEVGNVYSNVDFNNYEIKDEYCLYINMLKELCDKNMCELIFIVPPIPYASMKMQSDYQDILDFYSIISEELDIEIFNFDLARHEYLYMSDSRFYDYTHMSGEGAELFSYAAGDLIKKYIDEGSINKDIYFYSSYEDLLNNSPWIFNTWIEEDEDMYVAKSTYGNDVTPEYCFLVSKDDGVTWAVLREYDVVDYIAKDLIPDDCDGLMLWTRPLGESSDDAIYQQCYKVSLS